MPITEGEKREIELRRRARIVGWAVLVLVVVGVIWAWRASSSSTSTSTPSATTATTSSGSSMAAWAGKARPSISIAGDVFSDLSTAATTGDLRGLRTACVEVGPNMQVLRNLLPSPDAELNREFASAIEAYEFGADACIEGVDAESASILTAANSHFERGASHMARVRTIIERS